MSENNINPKIAMILLAAGESKRMGKIKQLLPWKNTTLIGHSIEQALLSNIDSLYVVLGANYNTISESIQKNKITLIENKDWKEGMGSSIGCAIRYFINSNINLSAIIIGLIDQPLINSKHINNIIAKYLDNNYNIISTKINNTPGVPALFSSIHFSELNKLNKDNGARKIILQHNKDNHVLDIGNKTIDLDTFEDYVILFNKYGKI